MVPISSRVRGTLELRCRQPAIDSFQADEIDGIASSSVTGSGLCRKFPVEPDVGVEGSPEELKIAKKRPARPDVLQIEDFAHPL